MQLESPGMALTYNPEIFSVPNLSQAKNIILTAESSTTEERWKTETPMLSALISANKSALISANNKIGPDTVVLWAFSNLVVQWPPTTFEP
jgi:hypothetical protein